MLGSVEQGEPGLVVARPRSLGALAQATLPDRGHFGVGRRAADLELDPRLRSEPLCHLGQPLPRGLVQLGRAGSEADRLDLHPADASPQRHHLADRAEGRGRELHDGVPHCIPDGVRQAEAGTRQLAADRDPEVDGPVEPLQEIEDERERYADPLPERVARPLPELDLPDRQLGHRVEPARLAGELHVGGQVPAADPVPEVAAGVRIELRDRVALEIALELESRVVGEQAEPARQPQRRVAETPLERQVCGPGAGTESGDRHVHVRQLAGEGGDDRLVAQPHGPARYPESIDGPGGAGWGRGGRRRARGPRRRRRGQGRQVEAAVLVAHQSHDGPLDLDPIERRAHGRPEHDPPDTDAQAASAGDRRRRGIRTRLVAPHLHVARGQPSAERRGAVPEPALEHSADRRGAGARRSERGVRVGGEGGERQIGEPRAQRAGNRLRSESPAQLEPPVTEAGGPGEGGVTGMLAESEAGHGEVHVLDRHHRGRRHRTVHQPELAVRDPRPLDVEREAGALAGTRPGRAGRQQAVEREPAIRRPLERQTRGAQRELAHRRPAGQEVDPGALHQDPVHAEARIAALRRTNPQRTDRGPSRHDVLGGAAFRRAQEVSRLGVHDLAELERRRPGQIGREQRQVQLRDGEPQRHAARAAQRRRGAVERDGAAPDRQLGPERRGRDPQTGVGRDAAGGQLDVGDASLHRRRLGPIAERDRAAVDRERLHRRAGSVRGLPGWPPGVEHVEPRRSGAHQVELRLVEREIAEHGLPMEQRPVPDLGVEHGHPEERRRFGADAEPGDPGPSGEQIEIDVVDRHRLDHSSLEAGDEPPPDELGSREDDAGDEHHQDGGRDPEPDAA